MSSPHFPFRKFTDAQRTRIARRRLKAAQNARPDAALLDDLQRTINTQLNGIIGVLEMIRQAELAADQRELLSLAQRSADALLSRTGRLLETDCARNSERDDRTTCANNALSGMRILIAMQDTASRTRIEADLHGLGMRATVFDHVDAALRALEEAAADNDPYRIALLDQAINGIDGETLGVSIGNTPTLRDTLIVLASDEHGRHDAERLALAGLSAWLPKPVSNATLIETLAMLNDCIRRNDAPRFICDGIRMTRQSSLSQQDSFAEAHVLIVDDNPLNLEVARRMLTHHGCMIDTADNGRQALQMTATQRYDLILMDCQMSETDGYQTTALIRAAENEPASGRAHTPIIGWSSRTSRNERDTCLAIGMDDFIAKPMRMRELNALLIRWLHRTETQESATPTDDELDATQQMFGDDFPELARLFLADSPRRLHSLRDAMSTSDTPAVVKLAHVLCGSAASMGATLLAALCRELEVAAKNDMLEEARPRLGTIEREYARIHARLTDMLQPHNHLPPVR